MWTEKTIIKIFVAKEITKTSKSYRITVALETISPPSASPCPVEDNMHFWKWGCTEVGSIDKKKKKAKLMKGKKP